MIRRLLALFHRKPRPLELWRTPWKSLGGVRNLALGIGAATDSTGLHKRGLQ